MKEHGVSLDNHASKAHAAEIQKYIELAEALLTNIAVLEQEDEGGHYTDRTTRAATRSSTSFKECRTSMLFT